MEALVACYGGSSESDSGEEAITPTNTNPTGASLLLPPPPIHLLNRPNTLASLTTSFQASPPTRLRTFPHVDGNFALHVFIPVYISQTPKKKLAQFLRRVSSSVPGLHVVGVDVPIEVLCKDDEKLEQVAIGREFHISLGRTVPIRVHQIDSVVAMLRQKLQFQRGYWIDFNKLEVFVNDEQTRSFISLEVIRGGLSETITDGDNH